MRAVIQRVLGASVEVGGETVGEIGRGFLVLLGVMRGDTEAEAALLAAKTAKLRVFEDENEKMNLALPDVGGEVLAVSQFTLCADCRKGNRPSFDPAAAPDEAKRLYEFYVDELEKNGLPRPQTGIFAADMKVSLVNDGPVTIILDTDKMAVPGRKG
ncbi:MAG: D-tyrosyl-tRNA(Tyr) deacylase [Clostridia bacterium]|nr:D-tyrosyl-tRNA(Tyr) deacylase [Clostridia bacterium]